MVIVSELRQQGLDSLQILETIDLFKKKYSEERQIAGFIIFAIGGLLGFVGCVFTMLDFYPNLREFFLYGLTSVAVIMVFISLYLILE
jgi:hypothetical protein